VPLPGAASHRVGLPAWLVRLYLTLAYGGDVPRAANRPLELPGLSVLVRAGI